VCHEQPGQREAAARVRFAGLRVRERHPFHVPAFARRKK
jgi:hypothetical protein